ncbi:hypothetical protein AAFH68_48730 [Flavobacterium sp. CGRL1]
MKDLSSIAIMTCWYGDYPWYFPYFVKSCKYNPSIDFIIVTDNTNVIPEKPDNIKVVYKTLEDFKINASQKLGFEVVINKPYKLCDFKPAYRFLFPEILGSYDFWGHGDIDMVYGDIRGFMTNELLADFDILNSRVDFITGTFCLYRNIEKLNTLFMQSRDYKHVFTNEEYFSFDECSFLFNDLALGNSILDYPDSIQSMTYLAVKGELEGNFKVFFDHIIAQGVSDEIKWQNGLILFKNQFECMFYDMIEYKVKCENKKAVYPIPDVFYFNIKGINKNSFFRLLYSKILDNWEKLKDFIQKKEPQTAE